MKTILFSRADNCRTKDEAEMLFSAVARYGLDYAINREFAETVERLTGRALPAEKIYDGRVGATDGECVMVCWGGDGTLLEGVHRLDGGQVPVVGINSGHLGFLSVASTRHTDEIFGRIARRELTVERRPMLEIEGLGGAEKKYYALNEVAVQRFGATMVSIDVYVDDRHIATCDGSGLIVATPTGSTAYSLSAGGPVVEPSCRCLTIAPLVPHNLTMRPIVIPDTSRIRLDIDPRRRPLTVSLDNRQHETEQRSSLTVRRSEREVFLAMPHNISFYDTLRNKMMWGVDIRS